MPPRSVHGSNAFRVSSFVCAHVGIVEPVKMKENLVCLGLGKAVSVFCFGILLSGRAEGCIAKHSVQSLSRFYFVLLFWSCEMGNGDALAAQRVGGV